MRLIDEDEIVKALDEASKKQTDIMDALRKQLLVNFAKQVLSAAPTVDAVEVVRCKDCFYCRKYNEIWQLPKRDVLLCIRLYGGDGEEVSAEDYCSWGERREE